jgi:hypothetical protein
VVSTWYFDHFTTGEWEGFAAAVGSHKPAWADYLMADDNGDRFPAYPLTHGVPGGLPMLNFTEISMYKMGPWGGFGANPLPSHIHALWQQAGGRLAGGFPYSEGIFEDMNKAIMFQLYWNGRDPRDTVREYVGYEYSPDAVDELAAVAAELEAHHGHRRHAAPSSEDPRSELFPAPGVEPPPLYNAPNVGGAGRTLDTVHRVESRLTAAARKAWRWRVFYLRAAIDAAIEENGGRPTEQTDAFFNELIDIYHAQGAEPQVLPPSRQAVLRLRSR